MVSVMKYQVNLFVICRDVNEATTPRGRGQVFRPRGRGQASMPNLPGDL